MPRTFLWIVLVLAIAHAVLALAYSGATPYRQGGLVSNQPAQDVGAPDERQHANYVQNLLDGKGFPVFRPGTEDLYETYQSHQPPLYYVIGAGWAKVTGVSDVSAPEGKRLRWLNALLGAVTVLGVAALAWWGLRQAEVAAAAAAIAALLPMHAALSGAVSNDPLLFALCTWCLAFAAKGLRDGWTWRDAVACGVLMGLAFLTKTTALALVPAILVAVLVRQERRPTPAMIGAAAGVALLIGLPWWLRNQSLYGDPFAIKAFNEAFVGSPQASMFIREAGLFGYLTDWVGWWTARSFYGVFGYMDIFLNTSGRGATRVPDPNVLYRFLMAATALLAIGWGMHLKTEEGRAGRALHLLNGVFLLVVLVLFLRFNLQYFQGQARYLYPAIGPIAVGLGAGAVALAKGRGGVSVGMLVMGLLAVNLIALNRLPEEFAKRTFGVG